MYYNNYNTIIICTFFNFKTYGTFIQIYKCCENIFRHFYEQYDIHISCGMKKIHSILELIHIYAFIFNVKK